MNIEDQVCSLDLAKRLRDIGVAQESVWFWEVVLNKLHLGNYGQKNHPEIVAAFTVAELGEMLPTWVTKPDGSKYRLSIWREDNDLWRTWYGHFEEERTEADSRAKMLIFLIENKLMDPAGGTPNA